MLDGTLSSEECYQELWPFFDKDGHIHKYDCKITLETIKIDATETNFHFLII